MKNLMLKLIIIASAGLLSACAEQMIKPLDIQLSKHITVMKAREAPDANKGQRVRWGGIIAKVENYKSHTELVIVDRPLDGSGRPIDSDKSDGRFIADISGFLEPTIFAPGRAITVVGTLEGSKRELVGEYEYDHPEVKVEAYKLWDQEQNIQYYPYPPPYYWYNSWYGGWGMRPYSYPWYY